MLQQIEINGAVPVQAAYWATIAKAWEQFGEGYYIGHACNKHRGGLPPLEYRRESINFSVRNSSVGYDWNQGASFSFFIEDDNDDELSTSLLLHRRLNVAREWKSRLRCIES